MEIQQQDSLMKARTNRKIIAVSYRLYTHSFQKMLKAVWLHLLDTAVVWTAVGMLLMYGLYFFVPLAAVAVALEFVAWLMVSRWLTKRPLRSLFRSARRHWLLLVAVVFSGVILLLPVCAIVSLPLGVLVLAHWESQNSLLMGDPQGMPSYMLYMAAAVWLLTAFIHICIRLYIVCVAYYSWGSAEAKRREREQQKLNLQ